MIVLLLLNLAFLGWVIVKLTHLTDAVYSLKGNLHTMADTLQQESDALTAEETTVAALVKDVADEITKFQTAAASGVDTTPFVTRINAINTSLQAVDASALAAVPAVPVSLPPASPVPASPSS